MGFYEQISKYYDYIFPADEQQVKFISEAAGKPPKKILDTACGSGGYSASLARQGYHMTAVDLDEKMIELTLAKKHNEKLDIKAMVLNMLDISSRLDKRSFDVAFCIGNSIVHLGNREDILYALMQMKTVLKDGGTLIAQIINFDRVFKYNITKLPSIINKELGLEFIRNYSFDETNCKIRFNTLLTVNGTNVREEYENTIELLPLMSNDLLELLKAAGYKDISFYGDFMYSDFNDEAYMLVVKAQV